MLGDYGECVAIDKYNLEKAPAGSSGYDATTEDGKTVQIKASYASNQIGYRGNADLMLVIKTKSDASWEEIYFGDFSTVKEASTYSQRDNKHMISINKLMQLMRT